MQKWTFIISIALLFLGCADLKKSEQEERIDAMETQLSAWESELNSFDAKQWEEWSIRGAETVSVLKGLESDTISLEQALAMDAYRQLVSEIPNLDGELLACLEKTKTVKMRLKKLRKDIENGNGQRHKYNKYLKSEEEEVMALKMRFEKFKSQYETLKTDFPVTQEKVDAIISERMLSEEVQ